MNKKIAPLILLGLVAALAHSSCRPASYEVIRQRKSKGNGSPNPTAPLDQGGNKQPGDTPTSTTPPPGGSPSDGGPLKGTQVAPTARVEVIWKDQSVTRVKAGEPVEIRPSLDTLDPDDVGVSACINPGIVKADYQPGQGHAAKTAARAQGCEALGVPHVYPTAGEYLVQMLVTSNEGETATATMTLLVYDGDSPPGDAGGFTIRAHPMLAGVGQVVTFWGFCSLGTVQTITWAFADGGTAVGPVVTHAYAQIGSYPVDATCTDERGRKETARVTVVVIAQPVELPGVPKPVIPDPSTFDPRKPLPVDPVDPGTPCIPGQAPVQGSAAKLTPTTCATPGQNDPSQGGLPKRTVQY